MKVVLASGNPHKCAEITAMLPSDWTIELQTALGIPEVAETGLTFIENAILKARHAAGLSGLPAIADDSGLSVDCLHGAPGIYSRRYAGESATDTANNEKLLMALADVPSERRGAQFYCAIAFLRYAHDPIPLVATGTWEGSILLAPRGSNGFGYDPLFLVPSLRRSVAELDTREKQLLSHRGKALAALHAMLPMV